MNQRITFVHEVGYTSQIRLHNETLYVDALEAVREDRLTISLYELPQEVSRNINIAPRFSGIQVLIANEALAGAEAIS